MITVSIICVGKLKESYLRDGCAEYIKRLSAFAKVNVVEIAEERCSDNPSDSEIKNVIEKEGSRIISKIPKGSCVIPLCIEGKEYSSPDFSAEIEKLSLNYSSLCFVIGGSFGLSDDVKTLGKMKLSFGKMTLPHQLARMVLLEQIYRAFSISNNSKYHK
ncbi:MAG: 23S rRNA (pseudouridine(1915)-N(3))-methyltransferase RlmH [Eubacterium sp.]|nr:23S rRNA (pseudouridine(1915)-N(3))-methyltransferase RlmH [Eubacterium sp.]